MLRNGSEPQHAGSMRRGGRGRGGGENSGGGAQVAPHTQAVGHEGETTAEEKDSKVRGPQYPVRARGAKNAAKSMLPVPR